jgi:hypothetical protein
MRVVQMKPVLRFFWAKEWRLIKVVPMVLEAGFLLKDDPMLLLPKDLPEILQEPLNHGGPIGHTNGFYLNTLIFESKSEM